MKIISILFISLMTWGCYKESSTCPQPPCNTPIDTTKIDSIPKFMLVWQSRIDSDFVNESFLTPEIAVFGNKIVVAKRDGGPQNAVVLRDGLTGKVIWKWSNFMDIPPGLGVSGVYYTDGKIIANTWHEVHVIDTIDGQTIWRTDHEDSGLGGFPRMLCSNGYIYHARIKLQNAATIFSELVRSPISNPSWNSVKSFNLTQDNQSPFAEMPGFWLKPNGDTVIIFQNRQTQFDHPYRNKTDLYAINLRTRETEWMIDDLQKCNCTSNVAPPVIWQDKAYFQGFYTIYCLDASNGNIIWQKELDPLYDQLFSNNLIIEDGILVLATNSGRMHGLDPLSGNILWSFEDKANAMNIAARNGIIYSTIQGHLLASDVTTGKEIARIRSPHWSSFGFISINDQLGLIYVNDYYFTYCFKAIK